MSNIIFMFPGVGSHYFGMGKTLYDNFSVAKLAFEEASDAVKMDIAKLCFSPDCKDELQKLKNSQIALVCVGVTTYRVFMEEIGLLPAFSMGYSLGEYSALVCAGAIQFRDALQMVQERGDVVSDVAKRIAGTMAWVTNIDSQTVEKICEEVSRIGEEVYVSAYDSPLKTSISGTNTAIRKAGDKVVEAGGIAIPIKMSGPFHSPLMKEAASKFKGILSNYNYQQPQYPVISNYTALPFTDRASISENLSLQLVSPIRWQESLQYGLTRGTDIAIELGPKTVLKYLLESNTKEYPVYSFDKAEDLQVIKNAFFFTEEEYMHLIAKCLATVVSTKNYNKQISHYEELVVQTFDQVQNSYEQLLETKTLAKKEHAEAAIQMLQTALVAKNLPEEKRADQMKKVLGHKRFSS
ncbi:acyltransferase domain-containing protein [Brevibacillus laterosporus]|uniref:ACP S-malonyltransferase n=1 Tax=Brevibacillus TaxID=55080 RepID=UPI001B0BCC72|nr:acyltransferase domain-containing protein [Brevibacillus halotolerans]GIN99875.1 malonyl CoA-acyl carrier protein transacylase [Brevibacillus halotolerans]